MKSFLIDPHTRTITEVDLNNDGLDHAYELMKCDMVEVVYINHHTGEALYADEEGLLGDMGQQEFFRLTTDQGDIDIAGRALTIGTNLSKGETVPSAITKTELHSRIKWLVKVGAPT